MLLRIVREKHFSINCWPADNICRDKRVQVFQFFLSFILGRCLYPRRDWASMAVLVANYELAQYWERICRGLIYIYLDIFIDLQRQPTNLNQDSLRPAQDSSRTQNNTNLDRYC